MKTKRLFVFALPLMLAAACQKEADTQEKNAESEAVSSEVLSTRIVLELTRSGEARVVDVLEQSGVMPVNSVLSGDYVYEVRDGANVVAVESFVDPFEERALFQGEGEHHESMVDSARVVVRVPGGARGRNFDVRIHRLTRAPETRRIDATSLGQLQRTGVLTQVARIDSERMSTAAARSRRLAERIVAIDR